MEIKRKIAPPVYLFVALLLMWLIQGYFPVFQYFHPPLAYLGIIPIFSGIFMAASAVSLFKKAETGIVPFDEATTLVTAGFYRVSRNPMYLGMFLILIGVAMLLGSIGVLLPISLFVLIIRSHFVLGEERFLEAAFGQQYLEYMGKVRRWI